MGIETKWKWLENLPGIVVAVGEKGDIVYANKAFTALPLGNVETVLAACRQTLATELPKTFEMGEWASAGPVLWYAGNVVSVKDDDGSAAALALCHDITAYKKKEEQLRRCDALLIDAQGIAHWGTWEWDLTHSTLTWSAELYRIYGVSPTEFSPSYDGYLRKIHADDRERIHAVIIRVLTQHTPFSHDERILRPDGSIRHLHTWGHPVLDAAGKLTGLIGVCQDITEHKLLKEEIQAVERFRKVIFDTVGDVLFYVGVEPGGQFRFLSLNAAFTKATGLLPSRVIGHLVEEVIPEPSRALVIDHYRRAIRERRPVRWDEVTPYPSGTKYGEVTVTPLFGDGDACYGLVGTVHDITERVNAQAEASRTLTILNAIVEGTTDAVYMKNAEGQYLMMNSAGARWHDRAPYEIVGKTDWELLPHETAAEFVASDHKAMSAGETGMYEEGGMIGGKHRTFLSVKGPYRDGQGNLIGLIGISRDITERKNFELQIKDNAERSRALADAANAFDKAHLNTASLLQIGARRVAEYFHDGCLVRLASDDRSELQIVAHYHPEPGIQEFLDTLSPQTEAFFDEADTRKLLESGNPVRVVLSEEDSRARMKLWPDALRERSPIQAWMTVPLRVVGQILGNITVFRCRPGPSYTAGDQIFLQELADRAALALENARLYSEAQKAIQLREDFMSIASHELKTPLTPLKMQLQLLTKLLGASKPDAALSSELLPAVIATSEEQIAKLTRLIEDMLDYTRIQSGHLAIYREEVVLADLVSAVVDRHRAQLDAANCTVEFQLAPSVRGQFDRQRLEQVVSNLLANALKYGAGKPIQIGVSAKDAWAVLTIRDFGIGVAKREQYRIFGRFERAESVQNFGGLGLGLYIVRQIIEAHGGRIDLESERGQGALFTVVLPLT